MLTNIANGLEPVTSQFLPHREVDIRHELGEISEEIRLTQNFLDNCDFEYSD